MLQNLQRNWEKVWNYLSELPDEELLLLWLFALGISILVFISWRDRKSFADYVYDAVKGILDEAFSWIVQMVGENRSLNGFIKALRYIYFSKFGMGTQFVMINYVAMACSIIVFLASWLALKEFLGYPCGLIFAFVLQAVVVFSWMKFSRLIMSIGEKEQAGETTYYWGDTDKIYFEKKTNDNENADEGTRAEGTSTGKKDVMYGILKRIKKGLFRCLGIIFTLFIAVVSTVSSILCSYAFIFDQYLWEPFHYSCMDEAHKSMEAYYEELSEYTNNLRTYITNFCEEELEYLDKGSKNKKTEIYKGDVKVTEDEVKKYKEQIWQIETFMNRPALDDLDGKQESIDDIVADFEAMIDTFQELDVNTENIIMKDQGAFKLDECTVLGNSMGVGGLESDSDFQKILDEKIPKFIAGSLKKVMRNYRKLIVYGRENNWNYNNIDPEELLNDEWDMINLAAQGSTGSDKAVLEKLGEIKEEFQNYAGIPELEDFYGLVRLEDTSYVKCKISFNGIKKHYQEIREYYAILNSGLPVTQRLRNFCTLEYYKTFPQFCTAFFIIVALHILLLLACIFHMYMGKKVKVYNHKSLVRDVFFKEETDGVNIDTSHPIGKIVIPGLLIGNITAFLIPVDELFLGQHQLLIRLLWAQAMGFLLSAILIKWVHRDNNSNTEKKMQKFKLGENAEKVLRQVEVKTLLKDERRISPILYLSLDAVKNSGFVLEINQLFQAGLVFPVWEKDKEQLKGYVMTRELVLLLEIGKRMEQDSLENMPGVMVEEMTDYEDEDI